MRIERFTTSLQEALSEAQSIAVGRDHNYIEPVHVMQALLEQKNSSVNEVLKQAGIPVKELLRELETLVDQLPRVKNPDGNVQVSGETMRLFNLADKHAQQKGDQYISSELLLLAALEEQGNLGNVLRKFSVSPEQLNEAIDKIRGGEKVTDQSAEENRQALDKYTVDLTARAEEGKLDPDNEWGYANRLLDVVQILKNTKES